MFFLIFVLFTRIGTAGIMEESQDEVSVLRLLGPGRDILICVSKLMFSRTKLASAACEVLPTTQNNDPLCSSESNSPLGAILVLPLPSRAKA